jgi:Amino-terminal Zinc-binding domain of ubiquitin ligase E3A
MPTTNADTLTSERTSDSSGPCPDLLQCITPLSLHHPKFLVKRFTTQLLYGCLGPDCSTPTCLTYQQLRAKPGAFRRLAVLTARFQAHVLASEPDFQKYICPNDAALPPENLYISRNLISCSPDFVDAEAQLRIKTQVIGENEQSSNTVGVVDYAVVRKKHALADFALLDFWKSSLPFLGTKSYDPKSLTQSLFSTKAFKEFEWALIYPHTDQAFGTDLMIPDGKLITVKEPETFHAAERSLLLELGHHVTSCLLDKQVLTLHDLLQLKRLCEEIQNRYPDPSRPGSWRLTFPNIWSRISYKLSRLLNDPETTPLLLYEPDGTSVEDDVLYSAVGWRHIQPNPLFSYLEEALIALCETPVWISAMDPAAKAEAGWDIKKATRTIMVCIYTLIASSRGADEHVDYQGWARLWELHHGEYWTDDIPRYLSAADMKSTEQVMDLLDTFSYGPAFNFACLLIRVIARRTVFEDMLQKTRNMKLSHGTTFYVCYFFINQAFRSSDQTRGLHSYMIMSYWVRTIFRKTWNLEWVVNRWDTAGAAIELLDAIVRHNWVYSMERGPHRHTTDVPFTWLEKQCDFAAIKSYHEYRKRPRDPNTIHLLELPHLFSGQMEATVFRKLIYFEALEAQSSSYYLHGMFYGFRNIVFSAHKNLALSTLLKQRLRVTFTDQFRLNIDRDAMLENVLNQIWGREPREMRKSLKIEFAEEKGSDLGGLSNEFFQQAFEEVLDPELGMLKHIATQC